MKDAAFGIIAAIVVFGVFVFAGSGKGPTLQGVFEDVEKYKADQLMQEQIEQAKRTIEQQKSKNENLEP